MFFKVYPGQCDEGQQNKTTRNQGTTYNNANYIIV